MKHPGIVSFAPDLPPPSQKISGGREFSKKTYSQVPYF